MIEENSEYFNEVFDALKSTERRYALSYVRDNDLVTGRELFDYLRSEFDVSPNFFGSVLDSRDLRKLKRTGFIDYDNPGRDIGELTLSEIRDDVEGYDIRSEFDSVVEKDELLMDYIDSFVGEEGNEYLDRVFGVLADEKSRKVFRMVYEQEADVDQIVSGLVEDRIERGLQTSETAKTQLETVLNHINLPRLRMSGLVEMDEDGVYSVSSEYREQDEWLLEFLDIE